MSPVLVASSKRPFVLLEGLKLIAVEEEAGAG